jgi:hypothetical protein
MNGTETAKWLTTSDPKIPMILFTILGFAGMKCAAKKAGIRS